MHLSKVKFIAGLLLMIVCLAITCKFWSKAFPIAEVHFSLSQAEAGEAMRKVVQSLGHSPDGYREATTFGDEATEKNYVEKEYGVARLNEMSRKGAAFWYWMARFFKPEQHEEFRVWLDPEGHLSGYEHIIEEGLALPHLEKAEAQAMAETFLKEHVGQHPFGALHKVDDSTVVKPHRTDYSFTYEQGDLQLGDAPYQLYVTIHGNQVGTYGEGLKVPEHWTRQFARERETNALFERLAGYALAAIFLAAVIFVIRVIREHHTRRRSPLPWGWLTVFAVVSLVASYNSFPSSVISYPTTEVWSAFIGGEFFDALMSALGVVIIYGLIFFVADAVYRERLPGWPTFRELLGRRALQQGQTTTAMGVGIITAVVCLAYVTSFYVVGQHLGVWCPVDIDYSKTLSGPFPWIEPLQVGLTAAFGEEMVFRVVALLLILWLVRVRWIAVVLAAASWAFLHSNYPQMPGYIRGIELTLVGTAWGFLFLRYGIVATLTAHYLYDAWLGSLIVFQSASWANKLGALGVSFWPVAIFLWLWLRRLDPAPSWEIETHAPPLPKVAEDPATPGIEQPWVALSSRQKSILGGLAALLVLALWLIPPRLAGTAAEGRINLSQEQIAARADAVMKSRGFSPEKYRRLITLSAAPLPNRKYLLEKGSLDQLHRFFLQEWPDLYWSVRYFNILQPEQFYLTLDKDGQLYRWRHDLTRETAGADLAPEAALSLARTSLIANHQIDPQTDTVVVQDSTKQPHRRDYYFVFERKLPEWGEASLRTSITVQGDEPMNFSHYVKIPEAWLLAQSKSGWRKVVQDQFRYVVTLGEAGILIAFLVILIRRHIIPWRMAFVLAIFPTLLRLVDDANGIPWFYRGYGTTTPWLNYLVYQAGGGTLALILGYFGHVLFIGVAFGALRWAFGIRWNEILAWPAASESARRFWTNTLFIALISIVFLKSEAFIRATVSDYLLPNQTSFYNYPYVERIGPWLYSLTYALTYAFSSSLRVILYASVVARIIQRRGRLGWIILFLVPFLAEIGDRGVFGYFLNVAFAEIHLLLLVYLLFKLWRTNLAAVFLTYAGWSLLNSILLYLAKGGPHYQWNAIPLIALCGCFLLAFLVSLRRKAAVESF